MSARVAFGLVLFVGLIMPAAVRALESTLVTHLLLQMPLLIIVGLAIASPVGVRAAPRAGDGSGGPGMVIAITAALFWMLPRSMDAALENVWLEGLKFASLPLCVGVPVARSWGRLGSVARSFLLANLLSMLLVLGWLYSAAPSRVCNFYLQSDQARAGHALLWVAATVGSLLAFRCFLPGRALGNGARLV